MIGISFTKSELYSILISLQASIESDKYNLTMIKDFLAIYDKIKAVT